MSQTSLGITLPEHELVVRKLSPRKSDMVQLVAIQYVATS